VSGFPCHIRQHGLVLQAAYRFLPHAVIEIAQGDAGQHDRIGDLLGSGFPDSCRLVGFRHLSQFGARLLLTGLAFRNQFVDPALLLG